MHPLYSRERQLRQDILRIVADALHDRLNGSDRPLAEIHDAIEVRIDTEINEAVQDALRENDKS